MFELTYFWVFLLLPLPVAFRYLLKARKKIFTQIWLPLAQGLVEDEALSGERKLSLLLPWFAWIFLVLALTRPTFYDEPIRLQKQSRDMILSLDLSGSMKEVDMPLNGKTTDRLTLVKHILKPFIKTRQGDRLGLILFADHAYLQTPLTFDLKTIQQMIDESVIGLAGRKTAIGESIGLAIKRFVENENDQRVLILMSDGANNSGVINPIEAAEQAVKNKITIHTIGIGADSMVRRGVFGSRKVNPSRELDEKTLQEIATITGGKYFRARSQNDLESIYDAINELEPMNSYSLEFRPEQNLFYWPLSISIFSLFIFLIFLKLRGYDAN